MSREPLEREAEDSQGCPSDVTQQLRSILANEHSEERMRSLIALRDQSREAALEAAIPLLQASETHIRQRAASFLSCLKLGGVSMEKHAEALADYLQRGPDAKVRLSCAIVLMSIPGHMVDQAFRQALQDSSEMIVQVACLEVGDRGRPDGTNALFELLNHPSWRVRLEACKALITQNKADARVVATLESMSREKEAVLYDQETEDSAEVAATFLEAAGSVAEAPSIWGKLHTILERAKMVAQAKPDECD